MHFLSWRRCGQPSPLVAQRSKTQPRAHFPSQPAAAPARRARRNGCRAFPSAAPPPSLRTGDSRLGGGRMCSSQLLFRFHHQMRRAVREPDVLGPRCRNPRPADVALALPRGSRTAKSRRDVCFSFVSTYYYPESKVATIL